MCKVWTYLRLFKAYNWHCQILDFFRLFKTPWKPCYSWLVRGFDNHKHHFHPLQTWSSSLLSSEESYCCRTCWRSDVPVFLCIVVLVLFVIKSIPRITICIRKYQWSVKKIDVKDVYCCMFYSLLCLKFTQLNSCSTLKDILLTIWEQKSCLTRTISVTSTVL